MMGRSFVVAVSGVLIFTTCVFAISGRSQVSTREKLDGKRWVVEVMNGNQVEALETQPFISFDAAKKRVSGNSGCNPFSGKYASSKNSIRIFDLIMTMRACVKGNQMQIQGEFMEILRLADRFEITERKLRLYQKEKLLGELKRSDN